jgi:hypothetical protein
LSSRSSSILEIDAVVCYPPIFPGGFGMTATSQLTRSMRDAEPVVGVPTTLPMRTAALCAVAIVPFVGGWLNLLVFLHLTRPARRSTGRSARPRRLPSSSQSSSCRRSAVRCSGVALGEVEPEHVPVVADQVRGRQRGGTSRHSSASRTRCPGRRPIRAKVGRPNRSQIDTAGSSKWSAVAA